MKKIFSFLNDFLSLIYPNLCLGCKSVLLKNEQYICTKCLFSIPKTKFHDDDENIVNKLFWGRTNLENATAFCYFHKEGILQKLIHQLKYNGKKEVGYYLGKFLGAELSKSEKFKNIDIIIPVPLHPKRERQRGYNQSEWIAIGIAEIMNKKTNSKLVIRDVYTETQTKKTRDERWKNVQSIFNINKIGLLNGKHILLVDDVITTGATIESCAQTILEKVPNVKVSIASLAIANN